MISNAYRAKIHFGKPSRITNDTKISKPSSRSTSREKGKSMGIGEEKLKVVPVHENSANTSVNTTFILNNSYITNNNNYSVDIGGEGRGGIGSTSVKSNTTSNSNNVPAITGNTNIPSRYQPDGAKIKRKITTEFSPLNFYGATFNSKKFINVKN